MNFEIIRFLDKNVGLPSCYMIYALEKLFLRKPTYTKPKRILIVKLWGIGSIILASPTFKLIREKFPDAKITFLTLKRNKGVYEDSGMFDQIIYFELKKIKSVFFEFFRVLNILRKNKFDLALDMEPFANTTTVLLALSNIKMRVGYSIERGGGSILYDKVVVWNNKQHITESYFDIARVLNISYNPPLKIQEIPSSDSDKSYVDKLLKDSKIGKSEKIIGINVNASDFGTARRWPYQNFAKLADKLVKEFKVRVVFIGAPFDKGLVNKTMNLMEDKSAISLAGMTTVKQLSYLMQKFHLLITNDTGPMHIAAAMGTPVVVFFGPETPLLYGPLGKQHTVFYKHLPCSPCLSVYNAKRISCKHARCIKMITVDEVMEKVKGYMK